MSDEQPTREPLACPKCGKHFTKRGKWYRTHVAGCGDGSAAAAETGEVAFAAEPVSPTGAPVEPAAPPAPPALPGELEMQTDAHIRKEALIRAIDSMLRSVPTAGIVRRCTPESSLAAVQRDHAAVQAAVGAHLSHTCFHRMLVTACSSVERLTQLPSIKSRFDLDGYASAVAEDAAVDRSLAEVLAAHPELTQWVTPEAKLAIALLSGAALTAARNAEKKAGCNPGISAGGAPNSAH